MKTLLLLFCLLLLNQSGWAAKIYRWTDKEGVMHFSSTPGPNQSFDAQQRSSATAQRSDQSSAQKIFTGTWYGSNRTANVELRFIKKSDILKWKSQPRGGGVRAENFDAKWKYRNADLEIIYIKHQQDSNRNGAKAVIKIIDKSADSMILQLPDGKVFHVHKRVTYKRLSAPERRFLGVWQLHDSQKQEWVFNSRGFVIKGIPRGQYNLQTLASGSWEVQADTLTLTHLNDHFVWKKIHRTGEIERYTVLLQEKAQLILKAAATSQQLVLQRKR